MKKQKKRAIISAAFAVICCMVLTAVVLLAQFKNEAEAEVIEPKSVTAEKVIKNPVTVDQAKQEAAKKVVTATPTPTIEVAEAAVTVTVTPEPEKVAEPEVESGDTEEEVEFIATFEEQDTTFEAEETTFEVEDATFVEEAVVEESEPVYEEEPIYYDAETQEEMPTPADEFAYQGETPIGTFMITWYTREAVGYDASGASGLGCVPGYTCAVPEYWMLGHTIRINGYGYRLATDISPDGIVDLYELANSSIPAYGVDYQECFIVG